MSELSSQIIAAAADNYQRWPSNAAIYLPNGAPPQVGELFVQADLGRTIQYMIDEETVAKGDREAGLQAARDAFYRGDIAKRLADFHATNGGWLTQADLAQFRVEIEQPIRVRFGDLDVYTCGPWCQGPLLAQALRLLDGINLKGHGHNSADYIHTIVEAFKLAYADRHAYIGDPRFVDVPIGGMLEEDYIAERRSLIDPAVAAPGMPDPGRPMGAAWNGDVALQATGPADEISQLDTSYICVIDVDGTVFSATPSDGSSGGPVVPGLGFVPSTRGAQSSTDPSVPAVLAPGKRPRQAIDQPRFATFSYPRSSDPHSYSPGLLNLEGRYKEATAGRLRAMGHDVQLWPDWEFKAGAVCTIVYDRERGTMEGGSDPRRPTAVVGL
jgi:gamma-glutamyltranspeptidase/glutathione hydrolase